MSLRYFGTDGIRGPVQGPIFQAPFLQAFGRAATRFLRETRTDAPQGWSIVVGRDTRGSGPAILQQVCCGFGSEVKVLEAGVCPSPAVAQAVQHYRADLGLVVTASHNPAQDNGLKLFGPSGRKLDPVEESGFEHLLVEELARPASDTATPPGPWQPVPAARIHADRLTRLLPGDALAGWPIALDAAHGSGSVQAEEIKRAWGAKGCARGCSPDGQNINLGVGSEHPQALCQLVLASKAALGIALDGDADRVLLVDELGLPVHGDELLGLLAVAAHRRGQLRNNLLVVTVMSNHGLEAALSPLGIRMVRTPVGDREVMVRMRQEGASLGGESSGHIICADLAMTGDGLAAAIKVLEEMQSTGRPLSRLRRVVTLFPQMRSDWVVRERVPLDDLPGFTEEVRQIEKSLPPGSRLLVRYSGTEPKIRLLVESPAEEQARRALAALEQAVSRSFLLR